MKRYCVTAETVERACFEGLRAYPMWLAGRPWHGALGHALAQPQIATGIPGGRSPQQVLHHMVASAVTLDAGTGDALLALWRRGIEVDPLPW